jgi:hypothetical protein
MGPDITDDELASQLRRRAAAPAPPPTSYVAAVRGVTLDSRPSGIGTAGLAIALVAIALISVIASQLVSASLRQPTANATPRSSPTSTLAAGQTGPVTSPSATVTPTATAVEIQCSGDPDDSASVLDSTGLIRSCVGGQIDNYSDHPVIFNLPDDRTTVVLGVPFSLCFGAVIASVGRDELQRFNALMEERERPGCSVPTDARPVLRTIALKVDRPVDASAFTLNGWTLADEPALLPLSNSDGDTNGDFRFSLTAGQTQYAAGEPIRDIHAALTYTGPRASIDLTGGYQLIEPWQLEQLDGPIDQLGATPAPCRGYTMSRNLPVDSSFGKSGGYSHSDPLATFWDAYFADPDLRLPAGTWKITVGAHFSETSCDGQWIGLSASIVIRTVAERQP